MVGFLVSGLSRGREVNYSKNGVGITDEREVVLLWSLMYSVLGLYVVCSSCFPL